MPCSVAKQLWNTKEFHVNTREGGCSHQEVLVCLRTNTATGPACDRGTLSESSCSCKAGGKMLGGAAPTGSGPLMHRSRTSLANAFHIYKLRHSKQAQPSLA